MFTFHKQHALKRTFLFHGFVFVFIWGWWRNKKGATQYTRLLVGKHIPTLGLLKCYHLFAFTISCWQREPTNSGKDGWSRVSLQPSHRRMEKKLLLQRDYSKLRWMLKFLQGRCGHYSSLPPLQGISIHHFVEDYRSRSNWITHELMYNNVL